MTQLPQDVVRRAPKAVLHDHLDGGLRPATVIELAAEHGYGELPTTDPDDLARWFHRGATHSDLVQYLSTFAHTVGVMQHRDAVERVAVECAQDLAADGVVYAEVRFAPELHVEAGLTLDDVVRAALTGFERGSAGTDLTIHALLTAMRTGSRSREVAELALRHRDEGVVGFDIAGAEAGHPPTEHLAAFRLVERAGLPATIHAGEAAGLASIREALAPCGAARLGHGVRIVDDIEVHADGTATLGALATRIRDDRIPLEVCPTSNVHTGIAPTVAAHPIGLLRRLGFLVTLNTDNRLMSATSMTHEMLAVVDAFDWDLDDLRRLTLDALDAGFAPSSVRRRIVADLVEPGYAALTVGGTRPDDRPSSGAAVPGPRSLTKGDADGEDRASLPVCGGREGPGRRA